MIHELSKTIVHYLEKNNTLHEDREIYIHGSNICISTFIGTSLLFVVGILTNHFIEAIIYEVIMSSSRSILGGYHCKSYTKCITTYVSLFIVGIIVIKNISFHFISVVILEILSVIITYIFCPVQNINKTLSPRKYNKFKVYSMIYIFTYICLVNILYVFHFQYRDIFIYMLLLIQILTIGGTCDYEKSKK